MGKKIGAVILNWNRPEDTIACLKSLEDMSIETDDLEYFVVDNASEDDSVEKITKAMKNIRFKGRLVINEENKGFAGGNNIGMKWALKNGSDYVLVVNNDTYFDKKMLKHLTHAMESGVGAVSPKIYFAKGFEFHKNKYKKSELGRVIWYAGGNIDWANVYGQSRGVDEVDHGQYDKKTDTDYVTGTCILFSAEALRDIGLFDEKYYLYYEDTDISRRLIKKRYKIQFVPDAVMWHKVAQSSAIGSDLNDYFITRNRLLFGMRWAGLRAKFALFRESMRFIFGGGRKWQRVGSLDYYLGKFKRGSWV